MVSWDGMTFDEFTLKTGEMSARLPPKRYADAFLTPEAVRRNAAAAMLRPSCLNELLDEAARVRGDETLTALAALLHWVFFEDAAGPGLDDIPFPASLADEGERGAFCLLVALGYPDVFTRLNRARGIPDDVIADTILQIGCYDSAFQLVHGRAGIFPRQLARLHASMPPRRFFRIGRLEFIQIEFAREFVVYRNRGDGRTVAFCTAGIPFLPDGRLCPTDRPPPQNVLMTALSEDDGRIAGNGIDENARVDVAQTVLEGNEWECALRPGDPVLALHIPEGGGLTPERVDDAMKRALPFFDRHFPGNGLKGVYCHSWILSPQLRECLPPESNILAFQRKVHLLPATPNAGCDRGLWFLFRSYPPYDDPAALPRDTSMQRAVAEWLERGNSFCAGSMYALRPLPPTRG